MKENGEPRYMKIFSALDLITVGIVLLLNTTGVVSWKIWIELLRFWPLFLVSAGIGILFDFSNWSKVIGKILSYLLFLAMLFFAGVNTITNSTFVDEFRQGLPSFLTGSWFVFNTSNNDQTKETIYSKADNSNINQLDLKISDSKGTITLTDEDTDNTLFSVKALYGKADNEYTLEKTVTNEKMSLVFDSGKLNSNFMFFNGSAPKYDFELGSYLQNSIIELNLGAGDAKIDLKNSSVDSLNANTGAGKLVAIFTDNSLPSSIDLKVGAGEMDITIPKDAGYKIEYSVAVGGVKIDGKNQGGGLGSNDTITSENYATAIRKVQIRLSVGVGSFSLNFN